MKKISKTYEFIKLARLLNERFGITPLLYGSLGLEYLTKKKLLAEDIDILVPESFIGDGWEEFKSFLSKHGYTLVCEREHTFQKDEVEYSFAKIEELETFAEIRMSDIKKLERSGAEFYLLNLEQYLRVYKASSKDGYRVNVREKKDTEKIAFIKECLEEEQKAAKAGRLKIKHICRMTPIMSVLIILFSFFLICCTILSFYYRSYDMGAIALALILIWLVGLGFYFNYGLTVGKKYVAIVYFQELKVFKYSDVTRIEVWIDDDTVIGTVKAKGEKAYDFCFSDFGLSIGRYEWERRLSHVSVKISRKKAEKIESAASLDSKITIHNRINNN